MSTIEIKVPDIGDFKDVEVIEVLVKAGDAIKPEQSLITVESDKASMEIPSSVAGIVKELKVKVGDKVSEGSLIAMLDAAGDQETSSRPAGGATPPVPASATTRASAPDAPATVEAVVPSNQAAKKAAPAAPAPSTAAAAPAHAASPEPAFAPSAALPSRAVERTPPVEPAAAPDPAAIPHASPSVRQFARELGVDLHRVAGSGPKGRITQDDVREYVKAIVGQGGAVAAPPTAATAQGSGGLNLLPWPRIDFAVFGPTSIEPLSRIKKLSGPNLARNWVMIPHVTQFDEADITELEQFRKNSNEALTKSGVKLTLLAFVIKACVSALQRFPQFNASLDESGANLILKQYWNIGFAADTPNGLMVPVVKGAGQKGVAQIARELGELSAQAREGKLKLPDMQGASFTISSLGGVGGTAFTPIINAPEVAILGLSRSQIKPVWDGKQFQPRLMVPLSLSYDHRVIDGAQAARFTTYLSEVLADLRKVLL